MNWQAVSFGALSISDMVGFLPLFLSPSPLTPFIPHSGYITFPDWLKSSYTSFYSYMPGPDGKMPTQKGKSSLLNLFNEMQSPYLDILGSPLPSRYGEVIYFHCFFLHSKCFYLTFPVTKLSYISILTSGRDAFAISFFPFSSGKKFTPSTCKCCQM